MTAERLDAARTLRASGQCVPADRRGTERRGEHCARKPGEDGVREGTSDAGSAFPFPPVSRCRVMTILPDREVRAEGAPITLGDALFK